VRERPDDRLQTRRGILRWIRREQGKGTGFRMGRDEQRPLIGEIPVGGGAGDAGLGRRLLDGRGDARCHQLAGGGDQGLAGASLLLRSAGELIAG